MKTWLFNPFKFIAGTRALILGLGAMLITAVACMLTKWHLDGVIDIHQGKEGPSYMYFIEPVIDWLCLVLPLYIFGRSFSVSSVRFIDVAGTGALARYPMFFAVLVSTLMPHYSGNSQNFLNSILSDPDLVMRLILLSLLIIPLTVWTVALMYNAYSLSANLKGPKAAWSFIASILIAEILSKVIIFVIIRLN